MQSHTEIFEQPVELDVAIVGAGFAGLYALHRLRSDGFRVKVFEAGPDVGGTWYWNRYPGARCDAQSLVYCYMFDRELYESWNWREHYATQAEILAYIQHVVDHLELRPDIMFNCRVARGAFDEASRHWGLTTERGQCVRARHLIMATGALSVAKLPEIPGIEHFEGHLYHTSAWPREPVSFMGKRVAVIGTGSSGVQAIPIIAEQADKLTVFQRTPNFVVPARSGRLTATNISEFHESFEIWRERLRRGEISGSGDVLGAWTLPRTVPTAQGLDKAETDHLLQARWEAGGACIGRTFGDMMRNEYTNQVTADFVREMIRNIVDDSETARKLTPHGYPFGAKRICVGMRYYETFNRSNVALVSLPETPIEEITKHGLRTNDMHYDLDYIVFATGFDAVTGALTAIDVRGRGGLSLRDAWQAGPRAYLGLAVSGFPNLFTVTGPGSPGALSVVTTSIEQHVDWISNLLVRAREQDWEVIEADEEAETDWTAHVAESAQATLFPRANSWYMGANVPGKPRVFLAYLGGMGAYRDACDRVAADDYRGFRVTSGSTAG